MHIVTLGDVMLDVIAVVPEGLRHDDDSPARISVHAGGQAANVAAWAVALGARATLIGPRGHDVASHVMAQTLGAAGVRLVGIDVAVTGSVVSILTGGTRTMASDPGDQAWLDAAGPELIPTDVDWLHLSAYPLLRAPDPYRLDATVAAARARGARVSLDLSSAALIEQTGAAAFRRYVASLAPDLVFANAAEWAALGVSSAAAGFDVVLKNGPSGAMVVTDAGSVAHPALPVAVVDATGAGDALAAGYLVGGVRLAMAAAARCVSQPGAQPRRSAGG